jgi:hypothetical protein
VGRSLFWLAVLSLACFAMMCLCMTSQITAVAF